MKRIRTFKNFIRVSTVLMERLVLKELLVPKDPVVRPVQLVSVV